MGDENQAVGTKIIPSKPAAGKAVDVALIAANVAGRHWQSRLLLTPPALHADLIFLRS
jgi:hypothetical protein